jgi:hypothetical protein
MLENVLDCVETQNPVNLKSTQDIVTFPLLVSNSSVVGLTDWKKPANGGQWSTFRSAVVSMVTWPAHCLLLCKGGYCWQPAHTCFLLWVSRRCVLVCTYRLTNKCMLDLGDSVYQNLRMLNALQTNDNPEHCSVQAQGVCGLTAMTRSVASCDLHCVNLCQHSFL